MLDRITQESRRVLTFATIEAGNLGSPMIEPEHLLLALIYDDPVLVERFLSNPNENVRDHLLQGMTRRERISAVTVNLTLSDRSKRVFASAEEEAALMNRSWIGTEHILLGLLREEASLAAKALCLYGVDLETVRRQLTLAPHIPLPREERLLQLTEEMDKLLSIKPKGQQADDSLVSIATSEVNQLSERSQRALFYARYEAASLGSPIVENEHLLLGVLREDKARCDLFLPSGTSFETVRKEIKGHMPSREPKLMDVALPLSHESERVLEFAKGEATTLGSDHIGPEHLLLGLLREDGCYSARLLRNYGADVERIRAGLRKRS